MFFLRLSIRSFSADLIHQKSSTIDHWACYNVMHNRNSRNEHLSPLVIAGNSFHHQHLLSFLSPLSSSHIPRYSGRNPQPFDPGALKFHWGSVWARCPLASGDGSDRSPVSKCSVGFGCEGKASKGASAFPGIRDFSPRHLLVLGNKQTSVAREMSNARKARPSFLEWAAFITQLWKMQLDNGPSLEMKETRLP